MLSRRSDDRLGAELQTVLNFPGDALNIFRRWYATTAPGAAAIVSCPFVRTRPDENPIASPFVLQRAALVPFLAPREAPLTAFPAPLPAHPAERNPFHNPSHGSRIAVRGLEIGRGRSERGDVSTFSLSLAKPSLYFCRLATDLQSLRAKPAVAAPDWNPGHAISKLSNHRHYREGADRGRPILSKRDGNDAGSEIKS
jgi:hypothetical protein